MQTKGRSIEQMIEEQVRRWEISRQEKKAPEKGINIVTVSREPGSGGRLVAKKVAEILGFEIFHQEVVHEMAKSAKVSERILQTLDERGITSLEDWIASLVDDKHLWPDQYLKHLLNVVGTIGKHGDVVIVGRGANFILPSDICLRVRIVAPLKTRIANVAKEYGVSKGEAEKRVLRTESDRRSFIRKYFYSNIAEPANYDIVLNTGYLSLEKAARAIVSALGR